VASGHRIVALAWHQRTSAIDTRERLLGVLASGADRALLATCHRVELYLALPDDADAGRMVAELGIPGRDRASMAVLEGSAAVAHLFAVASGLDSAVVGEPQILGQVRRACATATHPSLVAALARALHVGRAVRKASDLTSTRSVGSLAVDVALAAIPDPPRGTVLVVGAGEMGKLALRALVRRVGAVVVANRDVARAHELAATYGARAIPLSDVPMALAGADAVISAADTRGTLFDAALIERRLRSGPLAVVDIAVPRSLDADARALLGASYRSVDDLPGARTRVPDAAVAAAIERCALEARRFCETRTPERASAIRELRDRAERVRAAKLARAMKHLGHLSTRDRRIVAALTENLTRALLHSPTVALRERPDAAVAARTLFDRSPR
jgi:glutamyl-tRNA reductase